MDTWKAPNDVKKMMLRLIKDHHPNLVLIQDEIVVVFREKAIEKCGLVILGATKKAPTSLPVLTDKNYNYRIVIELGADAWSNLTDDQRMALIDHHLCSIAVTEDEEKGTISCSIRPPDFSGYKEEVERWGMWRPYDDETISAIENLFGDKESNPKKPIKKSGKTDQSTAKQPDSDDKSLH